MFRSPARTVGQLGAALALACLGLGVGVQAAVAAGPGATTFWSTSACPGSSWNLCFNSSSPHFTASAPLPVTSGSTITYHIQVVTELSVPSYYSASVVSGLIAGATLLGCEQGNGLPNCQPQSPVMWSMSSLNGTGFVYDFYYQVQASCGSVMPVGTNAAFDAFSPSSYWPSNYEYANVTGCPTPAPTNVSQLHWNNPTYVGVSQPFSAVVTSNNNPVTTGSLSFGYGLTACSGAITNMGSSSLDGSGSGSLTYAFTAAGSYVISVNYVPPSGSSQYQPSCSSGPLTVNLNTTGTPTPTPTPGSGISTNVSVAWGSPVDAGVTQKYSGTVRSRGAPVTVGTVWFGYGGTPCGTGVTMMGSAPVNSSGTGSLSYAFSQSGNYVISVSYQPPNGSLFLWSCSSSDLTVSPVSSSSPPPTPAPAPTPTPFPTATPNNTPNGFSFFAPSTQLPATGATAAPAVASAPPAVGGKTLELAAAPPRPLPELQVLNPGSVLALQALNAGPYIALLDVLAVLGLIWHIRRRVGYLDD